MISCLTSEDMCQRLQSSCLRALWPAVEAPEDRHFRWRLAGINLGCLEVSAAACSCRLRMTCCC